MRQLLIIVILLCSFTAFAKPVFEILPLGVYGGMKDGNLSAYLLKHIKSENYIALDGGSLVHGLEIAVAKQTTHNKSVDELLKNNISNYLISHAHLDHLVGLLIAQPELRQQQNIMARAETLQALQQHIFNGSVWGNFGDSGSTPHLNFQQYHALPLLQWLSISKTNLVVKTFPLSHGTMPSSAFLIAYNNDYILYFGDTGADSNEKSTNMEQIWQEVAPLVKNKQLHAIMLECSFSNSRPNDQLFGHLKPRLFMQELQKLASFVNSSDSNNALQGLPVVITHIKPSLNPKEDTNQQIINELAYENTLGIVLIRAKQGIPLIL